MSANPTNRIGLDTQKSEHLAGLLNDLLANYSVFYQNARGYHWNIRGDKFFELHSKFEELYNSLFVKIDEVAERILTLAYVPEHRFSDYLGKSEIAESNDVSDGTKAIEEILDAYKTLLIKQRHILDLSAEMGDEGTNAQMSDYIREQEKLVWMYSAYLDS
ncbi:MAG: Dps family protein [Bacteroidota bacterium]